MRILVVAVISLFLTSSFALGQDERAKDPSPKTFKEAYAGYQKYAAPKTLYELNKRTQYAHLSYSYGLKKFGLKNKNTANLAINWMMAYEVKQIGPSPKNAFLSALPIYEEENKEQPIRIIDAYTSFGSFFLKTENNYNKGFKYYKLAENLIKENYGKTSFAMGDLYLLIGSNTYKRNLSKSKSYLNKAHKVFSLNPSQNQTNIAIVNFWLAKLQLTKRKYNAAEKTMKTAIKYFDEKLPSHRLALTSHAFMVQILEKQGKSEEANKHCQKIGSMTTFNKDQQQIPLFKEIPIFPRNAARARSEGYVLLEFTIDENGIVQNPKAIESEGHNSFVTTSLKTISKYRFAPRFENGKSVETEKQRYLFAFELKR